MVNDRCKGCDATGVLWVFVLLVVVLLTAVCKDQETIESVGREYRSAESIMQNKIDDNARQNKKAIERLKYRLKPGAFRHLSKTQLIQSQSQ